MKTLGTYLLTVVFWLGYQNANAQTFPNDAKDLCKFSESDFRTNLTKIKLPVIGEIGPFYDKNSGLVYVFPANGPDFSSSSRCNFFEWAAQMFLWTTSTVSDGATVPTPVSPPSNSTPFVFNSEFFYRYSNGTLTPQNANGQGSQSMPSFSLRKTKPISTALEDSIGQAGSHGVLLSQGDNKVSQKESLVYYSVHTNRVLGYVAATNLQAASPLAVTYTEFPDNKTDVCKAIKYGMENGYARNQGVPAILFGLFCPSTGTTQDIGATPAPTGVSIPDLEPAIDYLSLTVELKASWVESDSLVDKSRYILQTAKVPTYTPKTDKNGDIYWEETGEKAKELAMVGMHVVGTVAGHPEMIWATIEHVNNAPDSNYFFISNSGKQPAEHKAVFGKNTGKNATWLFANGTDNNPNTEKASLCKDNSKNICPKKGESIASTNVVRTYPWGVKPSTTDKDMKAATISSQLISLNTNLFGALRRFNRAEGITGDPREKYFVSGANWGTDGAVPTSFPTNVSGSVYLSNSTMETFVQDTGCFGCHSAYPSALVPEDMTTSHIFNHITSVKKSNN